MSEVTVIVPIYNAGHSLHRCIQSMQKQTVREWNMLLIDDGSSDGSLQTAMRYAAEDSRIACFTQSRSGGNAARRRGAELARSTYISFIDADDWASPVMIEKLLEASRSAHADIAACNIYKVASGSAWLKRPYDTGYFRTPRLYAGEEIRRELVPSFLHGHLFPPQLHGKLYKRELFLSCGSYPSRIKFFGDDLMYNLEMFLGASTVQLIPDKLYYYRAGGMTSRYMPELFDDMVSGYRIRKEVIQAYYSEDAGRHSFGNKVMLLNTLRTCLKNLFLGSCTDTERLLLMERFCSHDDVLECLDDEAVKACFPLPYIRAIQSKDSAYLLQLGRSDYRKSLPKNILMKAMAKI